MAAYPKPAGLQRLSLRGTAVSDLTLLAARQAWLPSLEHIEVPSTLLSNFDVGHISAEALMFQSGYLTLEKERMVNGKRFFTLRCPNQEVRQSMFGCLLEVWSGNSGKEDERL